VADLGVAGLCLVVLQVRDRGNAAKNGLYRVGRTLDAQGVVQGGWSLWRDVPDWRSFRDQGAAVSVADLDGDGRPELVVLHVDDRHATGPAQPGLLPGRACGVPEVSLSL
jgi:FG-GAP repeat